MPTSTPIPPPHAEARQGFSLVELLVASALALIVMAAVAQLFSEFGRTVSEGKSIVDINARLRNAAWRLRQDLVGLTCLPAALVRTEESAGYFHVIEGPLNSAGTTLVGDVDDVLALTTWSSSTPFTGRLSGAKGFESPTAEVIWFCEPSGVMLKGEQLYNLHRRQLLVAATPEAGAFASNVFAPKGDSDLSYGTHANSLADLTTPATRFLTTAGPNRKLTGPREGEDVLLSNVVAFDVRLVGSAATAPTDQPFETRENGDPDAIPLRGIDVRIRVVEPGTGQVRELRVVHSFGAR